MAGSIIHFLNKDLFKVAEFTSNGSWVAPAGVNNVILYGCGGGGGGGGGSRINDANDYAGGGGGGGGSLPQTVMVSVIPGQSYNITVGTAGAGGLGAVNEENNGANGGTGGNTIFDTLVTFRGADGGTGGRWNNSGDDPQLLANGASTVFDPVKWQTAGGLSSARFNVSIPIDSFFANPGQNSIYATGGAAGIGSSQSNRTSAGGGGGASLYNGGNGANADSGQGDDAANLTSTAYGAGGGGGAGGRDARGGNGANGGPGVLRIYYVQPE